MKHLRRIAGLAVVMLAFFFLGRSLWQNWHQVQGHLTAVRFHWWLLPLPLVCSLISFLLSCWAWTLLLAHFGERLSLHHSVQIIAYSTAGRYVPGKIWAILGRVYMAGRLGIAESHAAASVVIETAYQLIAALGFFAFSLFFYPALLARTWLLLILIPVTLIAVYPPVFNCLVNLLLVRLKQQPIQFRLTVVEALRLFGIYWLMWLAQGIGLYLLTRSFYPVSWQALLVFPGAFSVSWVIGFIVLIAPGGLGVREGLFAIMLQPLVTEGINIIISLLSRIWITIVDLLTVLIVLLIYRREARDLLGAKPADPARSTSGTKAAENINRRLCTV